MSDVPTYPKERDREMMRQRQRVAKRGNGRQRERQGETERTRIVFSCYKWFRVRHPQKMWDTDRETEWETEIANEREKE